MNSKWLDNARAAEWDAAPLARNPTRAEQLDIMLDIIKEEYQPGTTVLDLGIGSGIVEGLLLEQLPSLQVVGIDYSPVMLDIARRRLEHAASRIHIVEHDLNKIEGARIPERSYKIAFSVQTLHHLSASVKRSIFFWLYQRLEKDGLFLLLDRMAVEPLFFQDYRTIWNRQERIYSLSIPEGESYEEHLEEVQKTGDEPSTLEKHLRWLREVGFQATCLHQHAHRVLLIARK